MSSGPTGVYLGHSHVKRSWVSACLFFPINPKQGCILPRKMWVEPALGIPCPNGVKETWDQWLHTQKIISRHCSCCQKSWSVSFCPEIPDNFFWKTYPHNTTFFTNCDFYSPTVSAYSFWAIYHFKKWLFRIKNKVRLTLHRTESVTVTSLLLCPNLSFPAFIIR